MDPSLFSAVVFAGGGSRCVWQVGFWTVIAPALKLSPQIVSGASAGATMACLIWAGRADFGLAYMKEATAANHRNAYWLNLFRGQRIFPHEAIYRRALLETIDQAALARLQSGPDIRIQLARPPRWSGPHLAVLLGFGCYLLDKRLARGLHPELAVKAGFRPEVVSVRTCRDPNDLADLLLGSSCTPPFTPVLKYNHRIVLDGGLVDNVPVKALGPDPGPTLVLLTRKYSERQIPRHPGRLYVQPSEPVPVTKWDYTSPRGLQAAFDLGRRDGDSFLDRFDAKKYRFPALRPKVATWDGTGWFRQGNKT